MQNSFPDRELVAAEIASLMDGKLRPHASDAGRIDALLPSPKIQNHAANLAFLPDGSLACVWFGGTMEGMGDISIWLSTLPKGSTEWGTPRQLSDDSLRSEQNPILFTAPDGRLWLFHTSQPGGRQEACEIMARISSDGGKTFAAPCRIGDFTGIFVRQPPLIGPQGEWLLPGFHCIAAEGERWSGAQDLAVMLISRDMGESWQAAPVPDSLGAVHMNPLPAKMGVMPAFYRDRFAQNLRRSLSQDGGLTWSAPEPTVLPNNNSSIQAIRLRDGRIAIVLNPVNAQMSSDRRASLYDEIEAEGDTATDAGTGGAIWGVPRAPLSLMISDDEGDSFAFRRDLDMGPGTCLSNNSQDAVNREFSYPSIIEGPDGRLHIAYTYHRRAIRYVCLPPQG
jgi:predicted neuraminidase